MGDKVVYELTFEMLDEAISIGDKLTKLGFNWEFGQGPFGKYMDNTVLSCETILLRELGLHLSEIEIKDKNGFTYTKGVYKSIDNDLNYIVSCDTFGNFLFYQKADKKVIRDLFWDVFVNKKYESKQKLICLGFEIEINSK